MEGYVHVYHKKRYAKFWCILDGQQLSYYERLDLHQQQAIGIKGTIYVKNADVITMVHETRPHVIRIKPEGRKAYEYIDCEKAADQTSWFQCLTRAAKLHEAQVSRNKEIQQFASLLDIDPSVKLSQRVVSRAYRKICLKAHPDRGGDVEHFNAVSDAYTKLMAIQADVEARERSDEIEYEAIVEKGPEGIGLGMLVVEDPVRQRTVVQKVNDSILLRGLSVEANGEILPGDSLVGIDRDDCMLWPFSRIRVRLNAFRVPIGGSVRLRFQRRLATPDAEEDQDLDASGLMSAPAEEPPHAEGEGESPAEGPRDDGYPADDGDDISELNETFEYSLNINEPIHGALKDEPEKEMIELDEYRKIYLALENSKRALRESELNVSSWKERAEALLTDYEQMKAKHEDATETIQMYKEKAERDDVEIKYLKTKIQSLEDLTPTTATDVLQVSKASSGPTLDQVFGLKKDRKLISAQLAQLRHYLGEHHSEGGNESVEESNETAEWEERTQRYNDAEAIADQIEKDMMQIVEECTVAPFAAIEDYDWASATSNN